MCMQIMQCFSRALVVLVIVSDKTDNFDKGWLDRLFLHFRRESVSAKNWYNNFCGDIRVEIKTLHCTELPTKLLNRFFL